MNDIVKYIANLPADKRTLLAHLLQPQSTTQNLSQKEPLAVIGMACRFPGGANTPEAFWQMLREGTDAISEVPPDRWEIDAYYNADTTVPGKMSTRWGGFLSTDIAGFDSSFFGISPREADMMDPQQRILLEVTWEAIERAGLAYKQVMGSKTSVFIGAYTSDYGNLMLADIENIDAYTGMGSARSFLANRISYQFDLHGTSLSIDTACSSSLVALHLASQQLRNHECEMAIVGGVNLMITPHMTILTTKANMMASDGRCKTFDAAANGFVRGEGCGVVILKRLSDARKNGDPILALVKGSAVNQDGSSNGIAAPNMLSQQEVLQQALQDAEMHPDDVSYIETHGTGTPLGDPIEIEALTNVYGKQRTKDNHLFLGAVKTNIGHLEAAAGMASIIKTILCLNHQEIAPNLHLQFLNPNISLKQTPFVFPNEVLAWPQQALTRSAGISAFGVGGTNAHVLLQAGDADSTQDTHDIDHNETVMLPLSAHSPEILLAQAQNYTQLLRQDTIPLSDISYTASVRRTHYPYRLSIISNSSAAMQEALFAYQNGETHPDLFVGPEKPIKNLPVVMIFPGQGSQWLGMGRQLLQNEPVFRKTLERCEVAMQPYVDWSLQQELLAEPIYSQLQRIDVIQPVLFAFEIALASLWQSRGVTPVAVVGHSMGEVAAAYVAGILTLEDAVKIICRRSQLLRQLSGKGAMGLVELSFEQAQDVIAPYADRISIAVSNSSRSTVLSGDPEVLNVILSQLEQQGIFCRHVKVDVASHSPQMDILSDDLFTALDQIHPQKAHIPLYSTVTGQRILGPEMGTRYWIDNLRQPVLFASTIQHLIDEGPAIFLEQSPHPILVPAIEEGLRNSKHPGKALASLQQYKDEQLSLLQSTATLYVYGQTLDWQYIYPTKKPVVPLPAYPWQHQHHWFTSPDNKKQFTKHYTKQIIGHPLLGTAFSTIQQAGTFYWNVELHGEEARYLEDHQVQGLLMLPGATYIELALAAVHEILHPVAVTIEEASFHEMLLLNKHDNQRIQATLTLPGPDRALFQIFSQETAEASTNPQREKPSSTLHASVQLTLHQEHLALPSIQPLLQKLQAQTTQTQSQEEFYQTFQMRGLEYGPNFQVVSQLWTHEHAMLAQLQIPATIASTATQYHIHPVILDACFQVLGTTIAQQSQDMTNDGLFLPVGVKGILQYRSFDPSKVHYIYAQVLLENETQEDIPTPKSGSAFLVDEQGQVVLELRSIQVQHLDAKQNMLLPAHLLHSFYTLQWQPDTSPLSSQQSSTQVPTTWLIFADQHEIANRLQQRLMTDGHHVILVSRGNHYDKQAPDLYQISPTEPQQFVQLLQDVNHHNTLPCQHIVYLWGVDQVFTPEITTPELMHNQMLHCVSVLYLVQALGRLGWRDMPRLCLITQCSQPIEIELSSLAITQAPLWGLGRSIMQEQPALHCTCIDVSRYIDGEAEINQLYTYCASDSGENQIAIRQEKHYFARLAHTDPSFLEARKATQTIPVGNTPFRVEMNEPGTLEKIEIRATTRRQPGPHEVEVEVFAGGLNFLDVLGALGGLPVEANPSKHYAGPQLGGEYAGKIVAVGQEVADFFIDQEVVALSSDSFARFIIASDQLIAPKPSQLSFEESASIPIAFLTAYYALFHLGNLTKGDRILIHAASGGVGLAAVQLAQQAGAEIYATAGSQEKRDFLRSLGVPHVMDSRTLDFVAEIQHITQGEGVDMVLNSLAGEFLFQSFDLLRAYGRFIEIGKRDYFQNAQLHLRPFLKNLSFSLLDLRGLMQQRPHIIQQLLRDLMLRFANGQLRSMPTQTFPISLIREAFHTMAQAKHIGKLVISLQDRKDLEIFPLEQQSLFRPDGTYLIIGGLGGIGFTLAQWMTQHGAHHLALVGRKPPSIEQSLQLGLLREAGINIQCFQADVSHATQVAHLLQEINNYLPPLRGILHTAAVLEDGTLDNLHQENFYHVMNAKIATAWNLHQQTRTEKLDFFVFFSSVASMMGSAGQSNYAAANAFLDALAYLRQAEGLPATSINWGAWSEVGLAAAQTNRGQRLSERGIKSLSPQEGIQVWESLLQVANLPAQIGVLPLNIRQWSQSYPHLAHNPFFTELLKQDQNILHQQLFASPMRKTLEKASPHEYYGLLEQHLREQLAQVLRLKTTHIDKQASLKTLGIDSLMGLELRNRLENSLGLTLAATMVWAFPTIQTLTEHLMHMMHLSPVITSAVTPEPQAHDTSLLKDIEEMTEADAEALLAAELDSIKERE